jgi:hypothetical protein
VTRATCARCHRPLRPAGTTRTQYPGTLAHVARGHCGACYRLLCRGLPGFPLLHRTPDVDELTVEQAVDGHRVPLNAAERAEAVAQLTARGHSAATIATLLRITPRTVTRLRTRKAGTRT